MDDWESEKDDTDIEKQVLKQTKSFRVRVQARIDEEYNPTTFSKFGLCKTCYNFSAAATQYEIIGARCSELEIKLNASNPITECTAYNRKNELSIKDMISMATMIDVKRSVGFDMSGKEEDKDHDLK